jgi:hypothetical protein
VRSIVTRSMIETLTNTFHRTNQQHPGDDNEIVIMPSLATPSHALQTHQGESPQERSTTPGKHHTTLKKKHTVFAHVYHLWWWWTTLTITETATGIQQESGKRTSEESQPHNLKRHATHSYCAQIQQHRGLSPRDPHL